VDFQDGSHAQGTAAFLGFSSLERLSHGGESLLSPLRDGALALTPEITSALLAMADRIRAMLRSIEATGTEGAHTTPIELLPEASDLAQLVEHVVWAFAGLSAQPAFAAKARDQEQTWTGCVMIEGPFRGAVTVVCSREFAVSVGSKVFEVAPADLEDDAARDALAEFTNVLAGNVKSLISTLLGETCRLSLPMVANGTLRIPRVIRQREVALCCERDVFSVSVFELPDELPVEPSVVSSRSLLTAGIRSPVVEGNTREDRD
jgi:CheY-specific phosphatase CheX